MIGTDFKSALQEHLQAAGGPGPEYAVVDVLGPDHRRTFCIELRVGGRGITRSEGPSIKLAQQEAARRALETPEALAEAITAYQERRAARNNRHAAETAPPVESVESVEAATADPPHAIDDDNPFLAIVEELEAAQNGQGANGASAPPAEPTTGASVESAANIETAADDEADTGRTAATDA
jgi:double-stranded RNA binding protein